MKFIPLIWAGLWRKPLRTIFTLLSIVIAFLLFGMLQGVNAAFSLALERSHLDRLYVMSRISLTEQLPSAYAMQIEGVPGVTGVALSNWFGAWFQDPKNFVAAFAIDPARFFPLYPELTLPPEALDAMLHTRTGALIGRALAEKFGWKIGDRIPLHSTIWVKQDGNSDWSFDIVGILDYPDDPDRAAGFYLNYSYFDEARTEDRGSVGWFVARVADPAQSAPVAEAIDRLFANSPDETKTQNEKEFQQSFMKQIGDIGFITNSIVGAVFFTLLFLTGNTIMQSVRERIPELAVLKTLGFSDTGVLALILAESLLLCLTGACLGLAGAHALFPVLKAYIGRSRLSPIVLLWGLCAALLLAVIAGLPPAWRAKRLAIVDALAGR
jgi:putative ABC transport system permease protein